MTGTNEMIDFSLNVLGRKSHFIDHRSLELPVHQQLIVPLKQLKANAEFRGFDLRLASAYRNFDQQLQIWNQKASGLRVVLDANEKPLDLSILSPTERLFAILRWTALPGASRHHWGSDFDIYDANALPDRSQLKLTQSETKSGGVFDEFYRWLDDFLVDRSSGFFRPYEDDLGGVAPEPWHLSYRPLSCHMEKYLTIDLLIAALQESDIAFKKEIRDNIEEIFHRFVTNVKC